MIKVGGIALSLIISALMCQSSKGMETSYLLEKTNQYSIIIPMTVPPLAKAQEINSEFTKQHTTPLIIPHINVLQIEITKNQVESLKSTLAHYVQLQNSFEITMSPTITIQKNNTVWNVDNFTDSWNKVQDMHNSLKEELKRLKFKVNLMSTSSQFTPQCTVAYNACDKSLNKQINENLSKKPYYLSFRPDYIALVRLDRIGNIKNIIQYFNFRDDLVNQNINFHTHVLTQPKTNNSDENSVLLGQLLAFLLKKHYLNFQQKNESIIQAHATLSSEEE